MRIQWSNHIDILRQLVRGLFLIYSSLCDTMTLSRSGTQHERRAIMTLQDFIAKRPYLVWYARDVRRLSPEAVVESVLNYGDFDDVKKLIAILGMHHTARIFRAQVRRQRNNYRPEISNYFRLYFQRHAA